MALIKWDDSFSVKVAEIDRQHQKLISMINELNDAMKQGKGKDILGKIVNGLISYTATHFKTEENYFERFGYPDADQHKKEHIAFVQKVSDFKDGFEKGKLSLSIEVMNFLSDWLQNHIKGTDKKYSQFFNGKGLK
jgi:hemerythrin